MSKQFQILVGGVEFFTGSFGDAIAVVENSIDKPRFDKARAVIEAAEVGAKFRVSSRVKGNPAKATILVVEVAEESEKSNTRAKKGSTPAGIRYASWKWIVGQLEGTTVEAAEVVKVTDKRFNLLVNGEVKWYSPKEEVAHAMASAVTAKFGSQQAA